MAMGRLEDEVNRIEKRKERVFMETKTFLDDSKYGKEKQHVLYRFFYFALPHAL
jgi:hypothetical protein